MEIQRTERIHSLDSLRAIMMLLGVILHSAISYGVFDYGIFWPFKDPNTTHLSFDLLVSFIHKFRMPIFFSVAGFFAALLFYERGQDRMIKNRVQRILYPFLVFTFIIYLPIGPLIKAFSIETLAGNENALNIALQRLSDPQTYIPIEVYHLWFLNYLIYYSLLGWIFALMMNNFIRISQSLISLYNLMMKNLLFSFLVLSSLTFLLFYLLLL